MNEKKISAKLDAKRLSLLKGKVLEVGFAQSFEQFKNYKGGDLYGVDIQEITKPAWYKETKKCDLNTEPLPYADETFDTVDIGDLVIHVTNPLRFLSECNRVLKPGGRLVQIIENPHYYWHVITTVLANVFKFESDQHL